MQGLEANSVDAIVTDPPYGLKFMGKDWDDAGDGKQQQEWHRLWAVEALRVLKPGGHLLAFGGSRTYHRLASAVEDAGFEIRDQIMWLYGSGFPKSLDVSKSIDKQRYDRAEILQVTQWIDKQVKKSGLAHAHILSVFGFNEGSGSVGHWTATTQGSQPAVPTLDQVPLLLETLKVDAADVPDEIARLLLELNGRKGQPGENWFKREVVGKKKSSLGGTVAAGERNPDFIAEHKDKKFDLTAPATEQAHKWDGWGTALKPAHEPIVVARKPLIGTVAANVLEHGTGAINIEASRIGGKEGRWPANIILDEEAGQMLDEQSGVSGGGKRSKAKPGKAKPFDDGNGWNKHSMTREGAAAPENYGDQGGASRFFYCPKAGKKERSAGLGGFEEKQADVPKGKEWPSGGLNPNARSKPPRTQTNIHPTVKPIELMRYLCRLVTPPGGVILDPFLGSGSTGCAAALEGFDFIGIEREKEYVAIAKARIKHYQAETKLTAQKPAP
jgi:DNA modification methylase